ncbi:hypothetical protein [Rhodococcus sp. NPDC003348]
MTGQLRGLAALSALETVSLLALLTNLGTVHNSTVASILGPIHGAFYLAVAAVALLGRGLAPRTRTWALAPVLSGPITMVNLRQEARDA